MSTLTLTSTRNGSLRPLVEAALDNEAHVLEVGIRKTQWRLHEFESKYNLSTDEFLAKFAQNQLQHSDDFDEWVGESRMLAHLQSKLARLQGIQIAETGRKANDA